MMVSLKKGDMRETERLLLVLGNAVDRALEEQRPEYEPCARHPLRIAPASLADVRRRRACRARDCWSRHPPHYGSEIRKGAKQRAVVRQKQKRRPLKSIADGGIPSPGWDGKDPGID